MRRPIIDTLQEELDEVQRALQQNNSQRDSLQKDAVALRASRDELVAAIEFFRSRSGRPE